MATPPRAPGEAARQQSADPIAEQALRPALRRPPFTLVQWSVLTGLVLTLLVVLGWWTYASVGASLKGIRETGLTTLLKTETKALEIWIEDKKRNTIRWGDDAALRADVIELLAVANRGAASATSVCSAAAKTRLLKRLQPFALTEERVTFNVLDASGRIIAASADQYCGHVVDDENFRERLRSVFAGQAEFMAPSYEHTRVPDLKDSEFTRPLLWIAAPIRDSKGDVIAALAFGKLAEAQFNSILSVSRPGETGEAYAFDAAGMMLTESRFAAALSRLTGRSSTMLEQPVRDPGGDILLGSGAAIARPETLPYTRLAATALDARVVSADARPSGTLLEPYRNYRGASVIGAWTWLREYGLGIALEIDSTEAYEPQGHVQRAFEILFAALLFIAAFALMTSWWVVIQRIQATKRVGQYSLLKQIGEGGISRVYLARHDNMNRYTAVKVLKAHQATDEMVARFEREVQLCSQLSHPNTIEIYDYGRTSSGLFYYAMEYVRGITLAELVDKHGPLPAARVIHMMLQVCGALKEVHDRGLVHRDIKPQNIMLCIRGGAHDVAKVLDFGLVKELNREVTRDLTQYSKVLGTPLYMAPERLRNPADADLRADIYALAATAFYVLTGRYLFLAESDHDLTYQVLNTPAPKVSAVAAQSLPVQLDDLLSRCLEKDRERRPKRIEDVAEVLDILARNERWSERDARRWWRANASEFETVGPNSLDPSGIIPGSHGPLAQSVRAEDS